MLFVARPLRCLAEPQMIQNVGQTGKRTVLGIPLAQTKRSANHRILSRPAPPYYDGFMPQDGRALPQLRLSGPRSHLGCSRHAATRHFHDVCTEYNLWPNFATGRQAHNLSHCLWICCGKSIRAISVHSLGASLVLLLRVLG